jgi:hypothetical protein
MTSHKKVPYFWWDMGEHNTIIVESDIDEFPIVAEFVFNPVPWDGCAMDAISKAQMLIDELNSGRTSAKKELQQRPLQFDHK